jgi:hypothetical protein
VVRMRQEIAHPAGVRLILRYRLLTRHTPAVGTEDQGCGSASL